MADEDQQTAEDWSNIYFRYRISVRFFLPNSSMTAASANNQLSSVVGAGITRVIYLGRFIGPDIDKTRLAFNAVVAGAAESCIGVACACAPSLRACFRSYFGDSAPKANESSSLQATGSKALGDEPFDESTSVVNGKTKDFF